ncbi:PH (Pleckstrin Homology) domain-containing protein [Stackebrandtia endophytica]|uniref:PH (Pleckstrin Homology) domain-containing protein n=1 Tax=Stackebrandtia endophytica TaxID=1496996 RepID=A0A543AVY6_9ACTN|nr:PH domain-containing protein [Stackebrandtia endophytica]TQL76748.1 PH (Pleckstrin Homology) domain-containing protein [Stackebrandtia endophytica]
MAFPDDLLAPDETVAHRFRPHLVIVVRAALRAVFFIILVSLLLGAMVHMTPGWTVALMFFWFLCIASVAQAVSAWLSTSYCLTSQRVIWRTGFIRHNTVEIPLVKLDHINVNESLIGRFLRYGDITLNSASFKGEIVWRAVPEVKDVRKHLTRLRHEDQQRQTLM